MPCPVVRRTTSGFSSNAYWRAADRAWLAVPRPTRRRPALTVPHRKDADALACAGGRP